MRLQHGRLEGHCMQAIYALNSADFIDKRNALIDGLCFKNMGRTRFGDEKRRVEPDYLGFYLLLKARYDRQC